MLTYWGKKFTFQKLMSFLGIQFQKILPKKKCESTQTFFLKLLMILQ